MMFVPCTLWLSCLCCHSDSLIFKPKHVFAHVRLPPQQQQVFFKENNFASWCQRRDAEEHVKVLEELTGPGGNVAFRTLARR